MPRRLMTRAPRGAVPANFLQAPQGLCLYGASMINTDVRLPRYQRLHDDLAGRISRQEWRPGECIPSESELASLHGVAVGTVRKAIDLLVADGVLERRQGSGTFVRRARFRSPLFRFFRLRPSGAPSGEDAMAPESRILRREVLPLPPAAAAALRLAAGTPAIFLARLRLAGDTPLLAEEIWLDRARFAPLLEIPPGSFGDLLYPLYEARCGQMVVSADETLTVELAASPHARLLDLAEGAPVVMIERVAFDLERCPIEWRRTRGPAERFRYRIEIR